MSEKEKLMKESFDVLWGRVPAEVVRPVENAVNNRLDELKESNDSLRMAVVKFFNGNYPSGTVYFDPPQEELALSAGIVFKNGTWILKETTGEGE